MHLSEALQYVAYSAAIAVSVTVGKSNLKKQTIADQSALIDSLKDQLADREKHIEHLEGQIGHYADLVGARSVAWGHGETGRDGPASSEAAENGSVR